jgi:hypothetical protein
MVANGDRRERDGGERGEEAFALGNYGFSWLFVGDRRTLVEDCKDFRKPMLYPLSYEG